MKLVKLRVYTAGILQGYLEINEVVGVRLGDSCISMHTRHTLAIRKN